MPGQVGPAPLDCAVRPGIIAKPTASSVFVIQPVDEFAAKRGAQRILQPFTQPGHDQPEPVTDRHALLGVRD